MQFKTEPANAVIPGHYSGGFLLYRRRTPQEIHKIDMGIKVPQWKQMSEHAFSTEEDARKAAALFVAGRSLPILDDETPPPNVFSI